MQSKYDTAALMHEAGLSFSQLRKVRTSLHSTPGVGRVLASEEAVKEVGREWEVASETSSITVIDKHGQEVKYEYWHKTDFRAVVENNMRLRLAALNARGAPYTIGAKNGDKNESVIIKHSADGGSGSFKWGVGVEISPGHEEYGPMELIGILFGPEKMAIIEKAFWSQHREFFESLADKRIVVVQGVKRSDFCIVNKSVVELVKLAGKDKNVVTGLEWKEEGVAGSFTFDEGLEWDATCSLKVLDFEMVNSGDLKWFAEQLNKAGSAGSWCP